MDDETLFVRPGHICTKLINFFILLCTKPHIKQYSSTVQVGFAPKVMCTPKISAQKNNL